MKNITTLLFKRESHENIVLAILYLEKISFFPLNIIMKIVRKIIHQTIYHVLIHPDSLSKEAIMTLRLPHPWMIIIHPGARIGKNARIFHSVTIGNKEGGREQGVPNIGDNFFIGANSTILGNVKIGNNVRVAAHTLVLKDVEDNTTVSGLVK